MATLTFNEFIGGTNVIPLRNAYPSNRSQIKITIGDGNTDITNYTFLAEYETLIIDPISYDRSNNANFENSTTVGYFPKVVMSGGNVPFIQDALTGVAVLILPEDMYQGPMIPKARENVPITVVSFIYTDDAGDITSLRFPILMNYEPSVDVGDPTLDANFVEIPLGV